MKKIIYLLLVLLTLIFVTSCKDDDDTKIDNPPIVNPDNDGEKIDLSGVVFEGIEVTYDGKTYSIEVSNLPEGLNVSYVGNGVSEVGTYEVKAIIEDKEKNILKELTATIIIKALEEKPIDLSGVKFEDKTFTHNGEEHSIYVSTLPEGLDVKYEGNGISEIGTFTVVAKIYDVDGNLLKELTATLKIINKHDVELPLV